MKVDPIKDLSAKELADKMLIDLNDTIDEYNAELKAASDPKDLQRICMELVKYEFARKFVQDYVSPIELGIKDQYYMLDTDAKKDKFVREQLTYLDPLELLGSGFINKKHECCKFGITPPGSPSTYDIWTIIEVGSDYIKIMPDKPIPYQAKYTTLVKTPVVVIGVGMTSEEVQQQIYWAYENKLQPSIKED